MDLATTFSQTRTLASGRVGLVPTMGFLHEGHLTLMRLLRERCDTLVVSIYVNPTQFNDPADLEAYPRDLDRDMELAAHEGVDVVFAPDTEEVYPDGSVTTVEVAGVSIGMEGAHRPGHFVGVATVVAKLLAGVQPDIALFGRKDAQQLAVLQAMVRDLRFPVEVLAAPIVRDPDGLAMSSRNVRLTPENRQAGLALSRGLFQAATQVDAGEVRGERLEGTVRRSVKGLDVDYVTLASQLTMERIPELTEPAVLAVAAHVGEVRLIDNLAIDVAGGSFVPDRGLIMEEPSHLGNLQPRT